MKITLEVTGDNEGTESPWWMIVDPRQNMSLDLATAAFQVTGPFFSRKEAEDFLHLTHYNFSKRAKVWCASGYYSRQYKEACRLASKPWYDRMILRHLFWFKYLPYKFRQWLKERHDQQAEARH